MNHREHALHILINKTALTIAGGGVLGIAEVGALMKLEELGFSLRDLKAVSGSSVGSIIATAIACRATSYYIKYTLENMNIKNFQDNDFFLRSLFQLVFKFGLNQTKPIDEFAAKILTDLVKKPDITFKELYELTGIHLTITYLSLNYERTMYADYINEPDSLVREAIVKSSTIPLFYEAHVRGKGLEKEISCDGGTANNYPMNIHRENNIDPRDILGLKLISPKELDSVDNGGPGMKIEKHPAPRNVISYLMKIVEILRKQAMRVHVSENDWMLSVKINVGKYQSTDFELTKDEKKWLYEQGRQAVSNYIDELERLLKEDKFPY